MPNSKLDYALLEQLVAQAVDELLLQSNASPALPAQQTATVPARPPQADPAVMQPRAKSLQQAPHDQDALLRMRQTTSARIGVGRAGPRLTTQTLLTLRADHAAARDAAFTDVDNGFLKRMGLFSVQTRCRDKDQHITRPDLGRQLSDEAVEALRANGTSDVDVQVIVSDGLSSKAVEANAENLLPALLDGLKAQGYSVGTPFFVRFGRVAVEDAVAELLRAKVVCILIGERPGLATAESMSAYLCYEAKVGQPESRRTVVSNIHKGGISAVEAGAYLSELIGKLLAAKTSGVDFQQ